MGKNTTGILIVALFLLLSICTASAQTNLNLQRHINVKGGDSFSIDVNIDTSDNVFAGQVYSNFDPNVLEILDVTEGDFMKAGFDCPSPVDPENESLTVFGCNFFISVINNIDGKALAVTTRVNESIGGASGQGTLASITVNAKPISTVNVTTTLDLQDTVFVDTSLSTLSVTPSGTEVDILCLLGDINRDGKVRLQDLFKLAQAYWSEEGDPNWNPDADLNNDERIRLQDLFLLATDYWEECPYG